jgi:hypothetical protein
MKSLIEALEAGKRRGYTETRRTGSTLYHFQYAIKKENDVFTTYVFKVDEAKFDVFEDYADEETRSFTDLKSALEYLRNNGAEIQRFSAIKGALPF